MVESYSFLAGFLCSAVESLPLDEEAAPGLTMPFALGHPTPEHGVGRGFHERHPLWADGPMVSDFEYFR